MQQNSIPNFTEEGVIPAGDYEISLDELRSSILVTGPEGVVNWNASWRKHLVENLAVLVGQLSQVGITDIFINGSFVENKAHPNDIDGYFECDFNSFVTGQLEKQLNLLNPHKAWTWSPESRRPYRGYPKQQLPMWHIYRVELYPHYGQLAGIADKHGHELEFPSAFRQTRRNSIPKGIVKIKLEK